jgi:hypothetical protein
MPVAQESKAAAIAAAATSAPAAVYFEVVLESRKDLYGFTYKPGIKHVVDQATLDALGDAVVEKTQLKA